MLGRHLPGDTQQQPSARSFPRAGFHRSPHHRVDPARGPFPFRLGVPHRPQRAERAAALRLGTDHPTHRLQRAPAHPRWRPTRRITPSPVLPHRARPIPRRFVHLLPVQGLQSLVRPRQEAGEEPAEAFRQVHRLPFPVTGRAWQGDGVGQRRRRTDASPSHIPGAQQPPHLGFIQPRQDGDTHGPQTPIRRPADQRGPHRLRLRQPPAPTGVPQHPSTRHGAVHPRTRYTHLGCPARVLFRLGREKNHSETLLLTTPCPIRLRLPRRRVLSPPSPAPVPGRDRTGRTTSRRNW
jgi:hypothetical protein